jgi:hypothetical protein
MLYYERKLYFKGGFIMSNREKQEKGKDLKWKVVTTISLTGTATLGVLYYMQSKDVKQAKEDAELVRRVVGGPLIERLINNEERNRTRTDNKIKNLQATELTEATKVVLEELKTKRKHQSETIADFVMVREVLKKIKRD